LKTEAPAQTARWFRVLQVRVDAVQIPEAVAQMEEWIARRVS